MKKIARNMILCALMTMSLSAVCLAEDNIINEEGAIETYRELVQLTDGVDPASNSKLKQILADEEEHLQELKDFLGDIK